jgi:hypothetical protein
LEAAANAERGVDFIAGEAEPLGAAEAESAGGVGSNVGIGAVVARRVPVRGEIPAPALIFGDPAGAAPLKVPLGAGVGSSSKIAIEKPPTSGSGIDFTVLSRKTAPSVVRVRL